MMTTIAPDRDFDKMGIYPPYLLQNWVFQFSFDLIWVKPELTNDQSGLFLLLGIMSWIQSHFIFQEELQGFSYKFT